MQPTTQKHWQTTGTVLYSKMTYYVGKPVHLVIKYSESVIEKII